MFTLRRLFTHVERKGKPEDRPGTVYKIQCFDFQSTCIGETGRNLTTRLTEHKRTTKKANLNNSIAEHQLSSICWSQLTFAVVLYTGVDIATGLLGSFPHECLDPVSHPHCKSCKVIVEMNRPLNFVYSIPAVAHDATIGALHEHNWRVNTVIINVAVLSNPLVTDFGAAYSNSWYQRPNCNVYV